MQTRFNFFLTWLMAVTSFYWAPRAAAAPIQAALQPARTRVEAPPLRLPDHNGGIVQLQDYQGQVVVLNFWATECGGCRLELPSLLEIHSRFQTAGAVVIGVAMDIQYEELKGAREAWAKVTPFAESHHLTYPILMGDDAVTKQYDVQALPITLLLDHRGRVAAKYAGVIDEQNLATNIKALLAEPKPRKDRS